MEPIKLLLKGHPLSNQHAYASRGRVRFMIKQAKELKATYESQIRSQRKKNLLEEELLVYIRLYFPNKIKRDYDNYWKLINDAMQWTIIVDDNQIKLWIVEMFYDKEDPRVEIELYQYSSHQVAIQKKS